ncbi:MAG: TetR/AcrR family transcriptional regulator [Nocardioides sp.]|uniref:TetR/AcrR family transcriptional regulator n=1 Tax=Nocardioides sp. TaxID=35761 RepID=UPI003F12584A
MLNSVDQTSPAPERRRRLSAVERRRQLIGIGLSKIIETPIQDLPMDQIAAEAGISRGLLFHYFETKTDFYLACVQAAGRRILRNVHADESLPGEERVAETVRLMVEQIARRRTFYLALVHGHGLGDPRVSEVFGTVRNTLTDRVLDALGAGEDTSPAQERPVVHAWWAYVEDRALSWSDPAADPADQPELGRLVEQCTAALHSLLALSAA